MSSREICEAAPLAVAATLRVAQAAAAGDVDTAGELNDQLLADLFATEDAREGQRAFAEKRQPRWRGK